MFGRQRHGTKEGMPVTRPLSWKLEADLRILRQERRAERFGNAVVDAAFLATVALLVVWVLMLLAK